MAKKIIKTLFYTGVAGFLFLALYAATVISHAPEIDTAQLYTFLSESSTLYDKDGAVIDNVFADGGNRTNLRYEEIPDNMINAVVAIEDKTFWKHHGFNIVRIFGAIWDSIKGGGDISGTSTITQQLARNVYLADRKSVRTLNRKVTEAWYTVQLERNLTKEQIIEAYLNTIYLGYNSYGIESAAKTYFSKNAKDLSLPECVALAAIPKDPNRYSPIINYSSEDYAARADSIKPEHILKQTSDYTTVYNGESSKNRRDLIYDFMAEQGYITAEEKKKAQETDLFSLIHLPKPRETTSYFTDFVIEEVTKDLMEEGYTEENARKLIYTGGLEIHTTLDSRIQGIVESVYKDPSNFPTVNYGYNPMDAAGNILNKAGTQVLLYAKSDYLKDGTFTFKEDEYKIHKDGTVTLYRGKRLNFYNTKSGDTTDISIEFKPMYTLDSGTFCNIESTHVNIPAQYKSYDKDSNVVISKDFFDAYKDILVKGNNSLTIPATGYTLSQEVPQPQSAMVICDNDTGAVVAMVGGRNVSGSMIYNRALSPRQPGSSIKPLAVYSSALQQGAEAAKKGTPMKFEELDKNQRTQGYGYYWSAASLINDAPLIVNGKQWPKNIYNSFRGQLTMRESVEISCNVNAVRCLQQVGTDYAADQLEKFGITTLVREGDTTDMNLAALALGGMTKGISPLEMASAYTTFPNYGIHKAYSCYTEVYNTNDELILKANPEETRVIDEGPAFIMADILRTVVTSGTPAQAGMTPSAGKTGTTSDNYDVWFAGFTPQYSAAVWIGNDVNLELSDSSYSAARLWANIMGQVTAGMTDPFMRPPSSVIQYAGEYFVNGTQIGAPVKIEEEEDEEEEDEEVIDVEVETCTESGYIASPWCQNRTYVEMKSNNPKAKYYCHIHNQDTDSYPVDPKKRTNEDNGGNNPATEPEENTMPREQEDANAPAGS